MVVVSVMILMMIPILTDLYGKRMSGANDVLGVVLYD